MKININCPNNCSVIVYTKHKQDFDLLYSEFSDVLVESIETNVISLLKKQQHLNSNSIILLIDLESCSFQYPKECPELLLTIVRLIKEGFLFNTVPIVYSTHDSPSFMVKCLEEGAADFLIKPLSKDKIKTLFLNVTRYKLDKTKVTLNKVNRINDMILKDEGQVWPKFKGRLKGIFFQETWISKMIADYYTPNPSVNRLLMTTISSERIEYLKQRICSWNFLPIELDNMDLIQCVFMILNQVLLTFDQLESLRVPNSDLYHFIFDICNSYNSTNPYHNFRHAVDVLQANYYFLCKLGLLAPMDHSFSAKQNNNPIVSLFQPLDIFALLMASIGHDVGHPGVNNHFMASITTATPLAILYNDSSVLENFHTMSFFHLVRDHCFSQLTDLRSNPDYASFRKIVVNSILATDMSLHDEFVGKVKDQAKRLKENKIDFNDKAACEREKILLCVGLIKCADISNCARPFESAERWARILSEEFCEQGDLEHELGLTVLPINQRGKIPLTDFQLSFKKFIALKLFESISQVAQNMQFTLDQLNSNIHVWESMKKENEREDVPEKNNHDLPPQPSFEAKPSANQRSRSGI